MKTINTLELAELAFRKHASTHSLAHYTGILSLHGLGYIAQITENPEDKERLLTLAQQLYSPYIQGKRDFHCNFPNYRCGGNGATYLWWKGQLPEASQSTFEPYVNEILNEAPRDKNGILCHPKDPADEKIWIDVAFAVTPFLLYYGLATKQDDIIHQAWEETRKYIEILTVPETGLVFQAINFRGPGHKTGDHWSRGNGWAIHALTALVMDMPKDHPDRAAVEETFVKFCAATLKLWDKEAGLWHQEMTAPESYVETSGSGLFLHAFGVGIEQGLLGKEYEEVLHIGLRSYLKYITVDGSVHNTCIGCLSPNQGTRQDYIERPYLLNDCHAFGPVLFSFGQAYKLGIKEISIEEPIHPDNI